MRQDYSLTPLARGGRVRRPIEIAMTPMIDVIFLLLVFFLATSSFQIVEKLLPSGVSETAEISGSSDEPPPEPTDDALDQVVVKLYQQVGQPVAQMNGSPLADFTELESRLRAISLARADVPVVIDPEGDVLAADVVRAYDWARQVGLARVFLATRKPQ